MKRALKEISDMSTSLEASGMERRQAVATLEAIANSIEKFAVTPERLRETLEASQQALYERIKAEMDLRFDGVIDAFNQRFDGVNQRFDGVNERFNGVNQRFEDLTENVNQRFDGVNQRFEDLTENVNQRFDGVNQRFEDLTQNVSQRFDGVNQRFNDVNERFNDLLLQQQADSAKLFNLMLAIAIGMAGVVGGLVFDKLF